MNEAATEFTRRQRILGLAAAYSCVAGTTVALGLSIPLLPLALEAEGYSRGFIGLNAAFGAAALLVAAPLVPWLAGLIGPIRLLTVCFILASVCLAALPFTPIWAWFPLRFLLNAALQGLFVVSEIWINTMASERTRGRLIGVYGVVATAGFALGPAIAAQFAPGSATPFLLGAFAIVLGLGPVLAARAVMPIIESSSIAGMTAVLGLAAIPVLGAMLHAIGETSATSFLPVFAVGEGWSANDALLLLTAFGVGNVVLQIPVGWLADKVSRPAVLAGCATGSALVAAALPYAAAEPLLLMVLAFLWGGFLIGIYTVSLTLVGQMFSGPRLAGASAAFAFAYAAGSMLGPGPAGVSMDIFGNPGLGWFVAAVCAAYGIAAIVVARRLTWRAR